MIEGFHYGVNDTLPKYGVGGFIHPNCRSTIVSNRGEGMNTLKRIANLDVDADTRLLRKYDIVDDEGFVTQEGARVLLQVVLSDYKEKLIERLKQLEDDDRPKQSEA